MAAHRNRRSPLRSPHAYLGSILDVAHHPLPAPRSLLHSTLRVSQACSCLRDGSPPSCPMGTPGISSSLPDALKLRLTAHLPVAIGALRSAESYGAGRDNSAGNLPSKSIAPLHNLTSCRRPAQSVPCGSLPAHARLYAQKLLTVLFLRPPTSHVLLFAVSPTRSTLLSVVAKIR